MYEKKTVGQATASLVLGILSFILLGILAAIPAVICGHMARAKIKADPENLQGAGQALAGLIMGYIIIAIVPLIAILAAIAIPLLLNNTDLAVTIEGQAGCYTLYAAERLYKAEHGEYIEVDTPEELPGIEAGDLQGIYFDHYGYSVRIIGESNLTITATANGTDDITGEVIMTVSGGNDPEWSGSLLE